MHPTKHGLSDANLTKVVWRPEPNLLNSILQKKPLQIVFIFQVKGIAMLQFRREKLIISLFSSQLRAFLKHSLFRLGITRNVIIFFRRILANISGYFINNKIYRTENSFKVIHWELLLHWVWTCLCNVQIKKEL